MLFTSALRAATSKWVFIPARAHGRPAPSSREEVFAFRVPPDMLVDPLDLAVVARDKTADGVPRTVIGSAPRDPAGRRDAVTRRPARAQRSVLGWLAEANVAPRPAATPILTACVTIRRNGVAQPADTGTLPRLNGPAAARWSRATVRTPTRA